jgi:RNA methyltransferase, TrmH family
VITSVHNRRVAEAVKLKKRAVRERTRLFLVEGAQAVRAALDAAGGIQELFHVEGAGPPVDLARGAGIPSHEVSAPVMARLTSTVTPQGIVAVAPFVDRPIAELASPLGCIPILHAVRDPGNAGTVLRSADAAGADGVVFAGSSVDVYNPKAVRASAGSLFHLPIVRGLDTADALALLRAQGARILAMSVDGEIDLYESDLTGPVALVFGNEAWGLPEEIAELADQRVRIPLSGGAESLNLAAAASVCLFEGARQEREGRRVALETVIAAAAHDIRSPLTAMKGFGFALQRRWQSMTDEQRDLMFQGIAHDTDRMDAIVRLLVDAARIVGGRLDLFTEQVEIGAIVTAMNDSLSRDPEHPDVRWTGGEVSALIDPDRLRSALGAFVEAHVWWAREGPVDVRGEVTDGALLLEVSRAGAAVTAEAAEGLFLPRRPGTGSGSKIGLFVARGIAEAQGGTATATVEGGRLVFRLRLPVDPAAARP